MLKSGIAPSAIGRKIFYALVQKSSERDGVFAVDEFQDFASRFRQLH